MMTDFSKISTLFLETFMSGSFSLLFLSLSLTEPRVLSCGSVCSSHVRTSLSAELSSNSPVSPPPSPLSLFFSNNQTHMLECPSLQHKPCWRIGPCFSCEIPLGFFDNVPLWCQCPDAFTKAGTGFKLNRWIMVQKTCEKQKPKVKVAEIMTRCICFKVGGVSLSARVTYLL